MLARIQEYLSELYPLDVSRIVKEVNVGFEHKINPYYILIPTLIEIVVLKLKGHQFQPTGDYIFDLFTNKLNTKSNIATNVIENPKKELEPNKRILLKKLSNCLLYACILAPISEEFVFRGLMTPALKNSLSYLSLDESFAPIISSIMFGIAHPFPKKLSMISLGLFLEKINENNNGSLWSSTSYHVKNNVMCMLSPLCILLMLTMTMFVIKYLLEQGIKLEKELSKKSDFKSKTLLGAIHGSLWSLFALPHVFLADKFFPTFPSELSLSSKIAGTVALGAMSGAVNSGLHFFSGLKNKVSSKDCNDTRTLDTNDLRNNKILK